MSGIVNALENAGMGAVKGLATGGPIGAIFGGVTGLLPSITDALFGTNAPAVQSAVLSAVSAATGATAPTSADIAGLSPDKAADLRMRLAQIAADDRKAQRDADQAALAARLADVAGARAQTTTLAGLGSSIAWGAPVISTVITLGFFGSLASMMMLPAVADAGRAAMLNIMVGALGAAFTGVVQYWTGSNRSSDEKTRMLFNSTPNTGAPT
jgi:hypothetical protein